MSHAGLRYHVRRRRLDESPPSSIHPSTRIKPGSSQHQHKMPIRTRSTPRNGIEKGLPLKGKKFLAGSELSTSKKRSGVCLDLGTTWYFSNSDKVYSQDEIEAQRPSNKSYLVETAVSKVWQCSGNHLA